MLESGQLLSGVASFEGNAVPFALLEVYQGEQVGDWTDGRKWRL